MQFFKYKHDFLEFQNAQPSKTSIYEIVHFWETIKCVLKYDFLN